MTKVDIISGFLGAGKTTLIKKLIEEVYSGEQLVLIENEFGEIGIDGGFLKDAGIEITEMNSGCICCSLVGDFGEALKKVIEQYHPTRIIIEPSGVGKLSDVIKAVRNVAKEVSELTLDSFVTVADATKAKMYMKNFGEFFNDQIEHANTIILSRTQNMKEHALEETVRLLQEHNEKASIITTPWNQVSGDVIKQAMEGKEAHSLLAEMIEEHNHEHHHEHHHEHDEECCHEHHHEHEGECCHEHHHEHEGECCHEHHHEHDEECCHEHHHHGEECCCGHDHEGHHHADDVFTSWGVETPHKYDEKQLDEILKKLSRDDSFGMILRAKGIVAGSDGEWLYFDLVPGEYEIRKGTADYTGKLCVIGSGLKEHEIEELFQLG